MSVNSTASKQQLMAHYQKVHSAKAAIDNKTPRSLYTNPKSKLGMERKGNVCMNRGLLKQLEARKHKQCCAYSKDPAVNEIVLKLIGRFEKHGIGRQKLRKVTISSGISLDGSLKIRGCCKPRQSFRDPPADVLKLHASLFTEPKDFHPRTLKSAASSRIRELACYNPPQRRRAPENLEGFDLSWSLLFFFVSSTIGYRACLFRVSSQSNNGNLRPPTQNALADKGKERPRKSTFFNGYQFKDQDLPSKPPLGNPTSVSALTPSRKTGSAQRDTIRSTQKTLGDIEYVKFSSAVTNDILMNRQFSDSQLMKIFRTHLNRSDLRLSKEQQLRAIRQIAEQLDMPAKLMAEFSFHMSQSCINGPSSSSDDNSKVNEALNERESGSESRNSENSLLSAATRSQDLCHATSSGRPRQSDSSFSNSGDESDVEGKSRDGTISHASKSPANDQASLQQPSKSASEPVAPSGLSDATSIINSEIEKTSQFFSSLEIKGTIKRDWESDRDDDDDERTDIDDIGESYFSESFEDDK